MIVSDASIRFFLLHVSRFLIFLLDGPSRKFLGIPRFTAFFQKIFCDFLFRNLQLVVPIGPFLWTGFVGLHNLSASIGLLIIGESFTTIYWINAKPIQQTILPDPVYKKHMFSVLAMLLQDYYPLCFQSSTASTRL